MSSFVIKPITTFFLGAVILLPGFSAKSEATEKALIIGVSRYEYPESFSPSIHNLNLPGVNNDIARMTVFASQLGFEKRNIITLSNETASEQNIKRTLTEHFIAGIEPDDRVLIYFSGHGSVVWDEDGDESDGKDEVLLTYDAHFIEKFGRYQLTGRIIDDEMVALLEKIPSQRLLFLIDACHSGNINKSLTLSNDHQYQTKYAANPHFEPSSKFFNKRFSSHFNSPATENLDAANRIESSNGLNHKSKGVFQRIVREFGFDLPGQYEPGRVFFTATSESGKALADDDGSLFTRSLTRSYTAMVSGGSVAPGRMDLQSLKQAVFDDLRNRINPAIYEPQLFGDEKLIQQGY